MKYRIAVIDDEASIARSLNRVLTDRGYEVTCSDTGEKGLEVVEREHPHLVILDLKLPDGSGLDLIGKIRELEPSTQVIVITAFGDTKAAVKAIKLGAVDFLRKPYDLDELTLSVDTAAKSFSQEAQLTVYRRRDRSLYNRNEVLWESEAMGKAWDLVEKVTRSDATSVLITGESGTGKELVARAVHFESERGKAPFMELNCAAFQETLVENELFGHERGAFTGAQSLKRGLAELSDGGTLFLDEVGEMPSQTQAKLLRFLEGRSFKRVGGSADISVDIRIIAATNVDLEQRIEEGRFRQDLYYRLQVVSIELPPLRDRSDDVCLLAGHFLRKFSTEMHKGFVGIDEGVLDLFREYAWPGNVRELRNLIERIVLIEDDTWIRATHLPENLRKGAKRRVQRRDESGTVLRTLREVEDEYIVRVLEHCEGNKSRTARVLGLSRQGLLDRLKRLPDDTSVAFHA